MKNKEILKRLYQVQKLKSKVKNLVQEAFDTTHLLETTVLLLIQDLHKETKRK